MKKRFIPIAWALLLSGFGGVSGQVYAADELSGQFLATGNISTQNALMPSVNSRFTASFAPKWAVGNLDFRLENYTENSYHAAGNEMVRERKFETQLNYNYPLTEHLNAIVGILRHENYTFKDNYYWGVAGLAWNGDIFKDTTLSSAVVAEKRGGGGHLFYDFSGSLEYHFLEQYSVFGAAHIYDNFGEFDLAPTHKREYETGVNYYINKRYFAAASYFYHKQIGDPADRFSFLKLKLGVNF